MTVFSLSILLRMWPVALLCLLSALSVSWARPRLHPLSHEMVNYINKANTTWKVNTSVNIMACDVDNAVCVKLLLDLCVIRYFL